MLRQNYSLEYSPVTSQKTSETTKTLTTIVNSREAEFFPEDDEEQNKTANII